MLRLCIFAIGLSVVGCAQDVPGEIKLDSVQLVAGWPPGMVLNPVKCDDRGNIYLRYYQLERAAFAPVIKITSEGGSTTFDFSRVTSEDAKGIRVYDFAAAGSKVHVLGMDQNDKPKVLRLTADGEVEGVVTLTPDLTPVRFAVLPAGQMFVLGTRRTDANDPANPHYELVAALYEASGRQVKLVDLKAGEINLNDSKLAGAERLVTVELAHVEADASGAYLLFFAAQPTLYVISVAGEVERRMPLWTPGGVFRPSALRLGKSQLLVEYSDVSATRAGEQFRYVLYSALSGERIAQYSLAKDVSGALACYDWNRGFTFLTSRNAQRAVLHATAR